MATPQHPSVFPAPMLLPLALANGVAVSTLYWGQAVVARAVQEFGPSAMISVMPGAALAGYALGVAGLATLAGDLTAPRGLAWHFALLVAALCLAAAAPGPVLLTIACLLTGVGCALTQRLLASATSAVPAEDRAETIGWIIAAGLCGIVLARAAVPEAAGVLGWRGVFWADAAIACAAGLGATAVLARVQTRDITPREALPRAAALWRGEVTLRRAALQQAVVFAAFNMGWAIFPRHVHGAGSAPALSMGLVALFGAGAALVSGRLCGFCNAGGVARAGVGAVAAAGMALALGQSYLGMGLLDGGTQVALVANQARAQALASGPAMRGRLAAIVTTIGFMGGALGAALGNLLAWAGLLSF